MTSGPWYRIKQFISAVFKKITTEDRQFIKDHLNLIERALFDKLPDYEKKHAVIVAKNMRSYTAELHEAQTKKAIKIGLLHDIGKSIYNLSIMDKAVLVIFRFFMPTLYNSLAKKGEHSLNNNLSKKVYYYKEHAKLGAQLLEKTGVDKEITEIIAKHTDDISKSDKGFLRMLKKADTAY